MKRPAFQFYPGDWLRDMALRSCSLAARGLWMDMMCLMHDGNPYGFLKTNAKVIRPLALSRMVGATLTEVEGWLQELLEAGIAAEDEFGCIYSRRMIRDEEVRETRAAYGALGGNPQLKKQTKGNPKKVNHTEDTKVEGRLTSEVNQKPTPSSSSSSSPSLTAITKPIPPTEPDGSSLLDIVVGALPSTEGEKSPSPQTCPVTKSPENYAKKSPEVVGLGLAAVILTDGSEWLPSDKDIADILVAYPGCDLKSEFGQMRLYLVANPRSRPASRPLRFVQTWLGRSQNRLATQSSRSTPAFSWGDATPRFKAFIESYPGHRQSGLADAWAAWKRIDPRPDEYPEAAAAIMGGLDAWIKSGDWHEEGGQYVPKAANFLVDRRWTSKPRHESPDTKKMTVNERVAHSMEKGFSGPVTGKLVRPLK
jgi:hypothetical protein